MQSTETNICTCGSIGKVDGVRLCWSCHRYWNNDRELTSVSRVIRSTWPIPRDFEKADPTVLEHARERGIRVDKYFETYLKTGDVTIPAGEWDEVKNLLSMAIRWWDRYGMSDVWTQVILADDQYAGTADLVCHGARIIDLKCTYEIDTTYEIQLGAYADLCGSMDGYPEIEVGILHISKRFKEAKYIELDRNKCVADWRTTQRMFEMVRRRTGELK